MCLEKKKKSSGRCAFVPNIATVLQDHRCPVTAGPSRTDRPVPELHWPAASSILGAGPPIAPASARGKSLWSHGGRRYANYAMWCSRETLLLDKGCPVHAHFWRIPPLIGPIGHPRFAVCAFTVFPFSIAAYVNGVNLDGTRRNPVRKRRGYRAQRQKTASSKPMGKE